MCASAATASVPAGCAGHTAGHGGGCAPPPTCVSHGTQHSSAWRCNEHSIYDDMHIMGRCGTTLLRCNCWLGAPEEHVCALPLTMSTTVHALQCASEAHATGTGAHALWYCAMNRMHTNPQCLRIWRVQPFQQPFHQRAQRANFAPGCGGLARSFRSTWRIYIAVLQKPAFRRQSCDFVEARRS